MSSESDLQEIIKEELQNDLPPRFVILEEFPLPSLEGSERVADIVAFGWTENGETKTLSVECKLKSKPLDSILDAIGQTFYYSQRVNYTYLAAQSSSEENEEIQIAKEGLEDLGIGYYEVDLETQECEEVIEAEKRKPKTDVFTREAATYLAFRDLFEETEYAEYLTIKKGAHIIRTSNEPHISAGPRFDENKIYIQTNVSRTREVKHFCNDLDREEFSKLLGTIDKKVELMGSPRNKIMGQEVDWTEGAPEYEYGWKSVSEINPKELREISEYCSRLKGIHLGQECSHLARIRFRRKFSYDKNLKKSELIDIMNEAWQSIEPIHSYLDENI